MTNELIVWKGLSLHTIENCRIVTNGQQLVVTSDIKGNDADEELNLSYNIILDKHWLVESFSVTNNSPVKPFHFGATQYQQGKWKNEQGELLTSCDNCIDIDIFPTPFTNSLPLKRQPLEIGEEKEYSMLWIDLIEGQTRTDRQRYQRLTNSTYRFTSLDTNFTADIEFTDQTIARFYPGLFQLQ